MGKVSVKTNAKRMAWARKINTSWRKTVQGVFATGDLLTKAKDDLPHGTFQEMCEQDLDFDPSTAQRLMAIARDEQLRNPAHGQHLPPSWRTLYELTQLSDQQFKSAIASGVINPNMRRRDVEQLRLSLPVPSAATPTLKIVHDPTPRTLKPVKIVDHDLTPRTLKPVTITAPVSAERPPITITDSATIAQAFDLESVIQRSLPRLQELSEVLGELLRAIDIKLAGAANQDSGDKTLN
jgi:hypothetical protein